MLVPGKASPCFEEAQGFMKRILVIYYSQTGQLKDVVDSIVQPLRAAPDIEVEALSLEPAKPFPFPWPFWRFFNTFPECIHNDPPAIEPVTPSRADYDLVILAYQVWFLSPSMPMAAFLARDAERILRGKRVVTVIACRNMWLMAQEQVKQRLKEVGAALIDNVVLTDRQHGVASLISTPLWLLTGKRGPYLRGSIPAAGIPVSEINRAARFGRAIAAKLPGRLPEDTSPMLEGLSAVTINPAMIASETVVRRSLRLWGALLRNLGKPESFARHMVLALYVIFLVVMLVTVLPISAVVKRLLAPATRARIARQRNYFAAPSGESDEFLGRQA
jgi:hypothetical protein